MESKNLIDQAESVLQKIWGYEKFRYPQELIIQSVLQGKDTLALMPTGGGKSICYQVPAMLYDGVTIVISPLIALMKDQVYQLSRRNIVADAIFSGMSFKDMERIFDNCIFGSKRLLYISPERLQTKFALAKIAQMQVSLLAVDEAHCISQWGYDFRPAYLQIARFREMHPGVPILALTATATARVVEDIQEKLQFKERNCIRATFRRPNLAYIVQKETDKRSKMISVLKNVPGSSIVYAPTRRMCKEICQFLLQQGIEAEYYHAGLDKAERSERQDQWISGKVRVMVATNAFGMGIDHAQVRSVIHYFPPGSLEAYFQEAGRAGRDGQKSYAVLLYDEGDLSQLRNTYEEGYPNLSEIKKFYHAIGSYLKVAVGAQPEDSLDFELSDFLSKYDFDPKRAIEILRILEQNDLLYITDSVFIPSKLTFTCSSEDLYDYMLKNPKDGDILRAMLRIFQGVFDQTVSIDEFKLAKFLHKPKVDIVAQLAKLHALGLINYIPTKDKPQIFYCTARVDSKYLHIDMKKVKQLWDWKLEMLKSVDRYLTQSECRSTMLLAYFGELDSTECGKCDVCLEKIKLKKYEKHFEQIKNLITKDKKLWLNGKPAIEWKAMFKGIELKIAMDVIQYLVEEEIIEQKDGKLYFSDLK